MTSHEPVFPVEVSFDVRIPTSDPEVTLAGDLFMPVGVEGPVPALLTTLPYRKDGFAGIGGWDTNRWFASRGFAVLLVDFRGTGGSDGRRRAPFAADESDDAVAAIDWLVGQPWSNGRVGMWGISYGAIMSMRTAARRPKNLHAIIPLMGMLDPERDFVHPLGERGCLASMGVWGLSTLINQLMPPLLEPDSPVNLARWQERLDHDEPWLLDLWRTQPGDPNWRERVIDATRIEVPALCVAGWRDLFVDGSIRAFEQMHGPKQLIAGPWMHTMPNESPFQAVDFLPIMLDWWKRWLFDDGHGHVDTLPVSVYIDGEGWRRFSSWPPTGVRSVDLAVHEADSTAIPIQGTESVGTLSGFYAIPTAGIGLPLDQHDDDVRGVVIDFPVEGGLTIVGRPTATVESRSLPTRLVTKFAHVDRGGRSTLICAGVMDDSGRLDAECQPTGYHIPDGHVLRVVLSSSDFPRLWPAHGDDVIVRTVRICVPTVDEDEGQRFEFPRLAGTPVSDKVLSEAGDYWDVETRRVTGATVVTLGGRALARTPDGTTSVDIHQEIQAYASPTDARIKGTANLRSRTLSGTQTCVSARISVTQVAVSIDAEIVVDGEQVADLHWEA